MIVIPNYPCVFYHEGRCSHLGRRGWFGAKECVLTDPFVGSCRKMLPLEKPPPPTKPPKKK